MDSNNIDLGQAQRSNAAAIVNSENVVCPKCGSKLFKEVVVLKKVSPIITGAQTETLYPIPLYCCAECGTIPTEFLDKPNAAKILGDDKEEKSKEENTKSSLII